MKLAEALLLRAESQTKLSGLQSRILANIKVQDGDKPAEEPNKLIAELFALNDELCVLVKRINARNNAEKLADGRLLCEAIADRDALMKKRQALAAVVNAAQTRDYRLTHAEIKMVSAVSVEQLQKQIDELSKQFRELDSQIQALNWTVEL